MGSSAAEIAELLKAEAAKSPDVDDAVNQLAEQGAEYGRSIAPVGDTKNDQHAGRFRDSIHAAQAPKKNGMPRARIVSDDPAASFIEYGTSRTPEHGTFAQIAAKFNGRGEVDVSKSRITGRQSRSRRNKKK